MFRTMKKVIKSMVAFAILIIMVFSSGCNSDKNIDISTVEENEANSYICTSISWGGQDDDGSVFSFNMEYDENGKITELYLAGKRDTDTQLEEIFSFDLAWDENGDVKQAINEDWEIILSFFYDDQKQLEHINCYFDDSDEKSYYIDLYRDTNNAIEEITIHGESCHTVEMVLDHDENGNPSNAEMSPGNQSNEEGPFYGMSQKTLFKFEYITLSDYLKK